VSNKLKASYTVERVFGRGFICATFISIRGGVSKRTKREKRGEEVVSARLKTATRRKAVARRFKRGWNRARLKPETAKGGNAKDAIETLRSGWVGTTIDCASSIIF
jgi:hypothetical protein